MGCDALSSWLRSVQEAKKYQKVFQASVEKSAKRYFPLTPYNAPDDNIVSSAATNTKKDAVDHNHTQNPCQSSANGSLQPQVSSKIDAMMVEVDPG
jgi:hypothetical protein